MKHTPIYVDRTHGAYDPEGLVSLNPYRASEESGHIVLTDYKASESMDVKFGPLCLEMILHIFLADCGYMFESQHVNMFAYVHVSTNVSLSLLSSL